LMALPDSKRQRKKRNSVDVTQDLVVMAGVDATLTAEVIVVATKK